MNAAEDELYSLLVPLLDDRLIVPRACVAEVIRYIKPVVTPGLKPWMLGDVSWNGRALPVVSFEGAIGNTVPSISGRTRIVVFNAIGKQLKTGFFGVLTQGFPQLVRVNREVLKPDATSGWPEDAPVLCRVRMINEFPLIPDFEKLEGLLARESIQA